MLPSSSEDWTLTVSQTSPSTRLYSLCTNRPLWRAYPDAFFLGAIPVVAAFLTWPSPPAILLSIISLAWAYGKATTVTSESVLILGPLGIQLSAKTLVGVSRRFIAREHVHQAIIHEAIEGWNVVFYLALVVDSAESEMHTRQVFGHLRPRLSYLIPVWKGIREILFDEHSDSTCTTD